MFIFLLFVYSQNSNDVLSFKLYFFFLKLL